MEVIQMNVKVAINGFGRIGRNVFKIFLEEKRDWQIIAINDLTDPATLAHLLRYDSLYGKFDGDIEAKENSIVVNGKEIRVFKERDPEKLPWAALGIDIVIEATGIFRDKEIVEKHIRAGAKKVIISAPAKSEDITIVMGVNEKDYKPTEHHIISNASCTTNSLAPFAKVLDERFGINKGLMTTIHAYTNDQNILDLPHEDLRRARAAAQSIIPTTTGAAEAVALVLPQLKGKLSGMSMRVPTPTVSVVDLVVVLDRNTSVEEVNSVLKEAAMGDLKGILGFSNEPLVSTDYRGDSHSSVIDGLSTMVTGNNLLKIVSWYDNEWGYSARVVDLVSYIVKKGL